MVQWLHISNLHIEEKADWNNFEKELIKKCQEYDKIDLVIVTGDFHNFSDRRLSFGHSFPEKIVTESTPGYREGSLRRSG